MFCILCAFLLYMLALSTVLTFRILQAHMASVQFLNQERSLVIIVKCQLSEVITQAFIFYPPFFAQSRPTGQRCHLFIFGFEWI